MRRALLAAALFLPAMIIMAIAFHVPGEGNVSAHPESWTKRPRETGDPLGVPILLYHNIDGKGEFSVTSEQLRNHFELIRSSGVTVVSLKDLARRIEEGRPYGERAVAISFDDGYRSMKDKLLPLAREFGYPVTLFVYIDFIHDRSEKLLGWDDLRELEAAGVDIESHTISHADLARILHDGNAEPGPRLFRELYLSRSIISLETGSECVFLAFPYGSYSSGLVYLARLAGYTRVFSTEFGMNPVTRDNFCLRRHHIKRHYTTEQVAGIMGLRERSGRY